MNSLDLLYLPAAIVTAPWWARKSRAGWAERFGRTEPLAPTAGGRVRLLIHAVSVGEVNTLRGLVPMLLEEGLEVVVSVGTDTGIARAHALFDSTENVHLVRFPLDFSPAVRRFLDAVRPDAVALVELEVWPNFVRDCARRGIPVCVINGRLSARSFKGYRRLGRFFQRVFSKLDFAAVQDHDYAARFEAMGVAADRVHITGSMKWDAAAVLEPGQSVPGAEALAAELGIDRSRPLIVAGSTAPTDDSCEEAILNASCPEGAQLLCAPRKPEHFDAAFAALGGPSRCARRSARKPGRAGINRFLLDTIGELRVAYALADVVFVGRTIGRQGGSDPIEPVSLGKAVVMGPRFANFESIVGAFRAADALVICEPMEIGGVVRRLLADPEKRRRLSESGRACIAMNQGATRRHADLLRAMVRSGTGSPSANGWTAKVSAPLRQPS